MGQSCIFYAIYYEQAVYCGLATVIEELCYNSVAQVTALEDAERNQFAVALCVIIFGLDARQLGESHHNGNKDEHYAEYGVCQFEVVNLSIGQGVGSGIINQYQFAQEHGGNECTQSVECLRQIEAARCGSGVTQFCYVRVSGCLKEAHAYGYDKEGAEVERETVE